MGTSVAEASGFKSGKEGIPSLFRRDSGSHKDPVIRGTPFRIGPPKSLCGASGAETQVWAVRLEARRGEKVRTKEKVQASQRGTNMATRRPSGQHAQNGPRIQSLQRIPTMKEWAGGLCAGKAAPRAKDESYSRDYLRCGANF